MDKEKYREFYKYLLAEEIITEPFDEESFNEYIFDNFKTEQCNIPDVVFNEAEQANDKWEQLNDCGLDSKHPMTLESEVELVCDCKTDYFGHWCSWHLEDGMCKAIKKQNN